MDDLHKGIDFRIADKTFSQERQAVASIDPSICINCGKCRRICPTEAIDEFQRVICRLCPDCAEGPEMFPVQSEQYAHEHACSIACPLGTVPEGYVNLIAQEKFIEAYELISELNPLPAVCGRICHHPCEDECKRGTLIDKTVNIRGLKRFVTDNVKPIIAPFKQKLDKKIAIIGAGPAGIMAAFDLLKKGYKVTVFEAGPKSGGMMRLCIPDFRLDKEILQSEIKTLEDAGMDIRYNTKIGSKPSINDLFKDKYSAVLIAVGASKGMALPIEGAEAEKVYNAVSLMSRINAKIPVEIGRKAVVIGGGSVALDTARTLLRAGTEEATCVCIEDSNSIPAWDWEIEEAKKEGVEFVTSSCPTSILTEWVTVKGVEFKKVKEINCDEYGRLKPIVEDGTGFTIKADTVVFATGQKPDLTLLAKGADLNLNAAGMLDYDKETLMTEREGLFIAGDVTTAKGSVIDSLASGRKAALMIDNMLMGRELKDRTEHTLKTADAKEKIFPARLEKLSPQIMPEIKDRNGFDEIEIGFSEKQAVLEAKRCLKCGYENVDSSKCIGCGVCLTICPVDAIMLNKVQEGGC